MAKIARDLALLVGLLVICGPSTAEWTRIGKAGNVFVIYMDVDAVKINGNLRRSWLLLDRTEADQNLGALSDVTYQEHDCAEDRFRTLEISLYAGQMGGGKLLRTITSPTEWQYVRPGSMGHGMHEAVCTLAR